MRNNMNEMLDRVEMAIRAHRHSTTEVQAREAVRAIREPTEEMKTAPIDSHALCIWQMMIDAILEGR